MSAIAVAGADATVPAVAAAFGMVYQPIVRLHDHRVVAHEALMRPADGASPLQLLDRARGEGTLGELETRAVRSAAAGYDFAGGGLLLVNLSAHAILGGGARPHDVLDALQAGGRDLRNFVVEITERDIVEDCQQLAHAIGYLRAAGVRIALDDFGNGHSNFELWHELSPEFVKIDRFLVHDVADSAGRLNILKALVQVADGFGTELIAEGVERVEDLRVLRDLGIPLVQGYLLGRPAAGISRSVSERVRASAGDKVQVWPRDDRPSAFRRILAEHMLIEAPSIRDTATNHEAEILFRQNPQLSAIPVVDGDDVPVGLINRRAFNEHMAMPFARELLGRKPCITHMNASPVLCDIRQSVDEMSQILLGEDQRYLYDGFVITDNGRDRGVGTGEALVRRVTELRIDAARYANPLTQLPGNIPITEHVRRLVETGQGFVACYCDLNHFKPYNDQYGYFLGDRMIQLVASTLLRHADPRWDFVGHVGGDDFVMLMQSDDWANRCERIVAEFNAGALALFDDDDRARGVLEGEDRSGRYATFPLTTLTIGVVRVAPGERSGAEDIASSAARAKREAKRRGLSVHLLET
ncbi:phosphodiesterase [Lysobacteraceae bacterium NML93-0399]|nr:phosphodiesterase [Xanthomonadaceae bacterium NML93-0399]